MRLLDTRNAFEVDHGVFTGAIDWRLRTLDGQRVSLAAFRGARENLRTVERYTRVGPNTIDRDLWRIFGLPPGEHTLHWNCKAKNAVTGAGGAPTSSSRPCGRRGAASRPTSSWASTSRC